MPTERLHLVHRDRVSLFENHWTVGGERKSDQINAMDLEVGHTSVACDAEIRTQTQFCLAGHLITPKPLAVWTVYDMPEENYVTKARREGQAIEAFLEHAVGTQENFPGINADNMPPASA